VDQNISQPRIEDALNPLTPGGGVVLTYGIQAAFARPHGDWQLRYDTGADARTTIRISRALWTNPANASVAVQLAECDTPQSAAAALESMLAANQLPALPRGPTTLGEISFVQPETVGPGIYFLRANVAAFVSATGLEPTHALQAALDVDDYILQFPQKAGPAAFRLNIAADGKDYVIQFNPPQPPANFFYQFRAGGASLVLKEGVVIATLFNGIATTLAQVFLVDGSGGGKTTGSHAFDLPPRSPAR
jgi:hypothetical protein